MRETLYFKDDDDRLSFLFGNYITLTNIDEREIDRIIEMRISPINISVHTMNPTLRCKMMHNRFAGDALRFVRKLAEHNIKLNCQIVLCPGLNDGEELEFTLSEMYALGESLQSVACVPVGVTRYREGLYPLETFNKDTARAAIEILERGGDKFKAERGSRTVFPSDEFYLIAKRELPPYEFYEDFPQIENGVGMLASLIAEFDEALADTADKPVSTYSGGMQRRLNLACAMVGDEKLLLLDEPTVGADENSTEIILNTITALKNGGCAELLVSHRAEDIARVCDRVVKLKDGVVEDGSR